MSETEDAKVAEAMAMMELEDMLMSLADTVGISLEQMQAALTVMGYGDPDTLDAIRKVWETRHA